MKFVCNNRSSNVYFNFRIWPYSYMWRQTSVKMNEVYEMKSEHEHSEYEEYSRNTKYEIKKNKTNYGKENKINGSKNR